MCVCVCIGRVNPNPNPEDHFELSGVCHVSGHDQHDAWDQDDARPQGHPQPAQGATAAAGCSRRAQGLSAQLIYICLSVYLSIYLYR